nr:olfactory receptor 52 [Tropidothorax elegans]
MIFFVVHFFLLMYTFVITAFLNVDWEIAAEAAYYLLILIVALSFTFSFGINVESLRSLLRKIYFGIYHYGDTIDSETEKLVKSLTKNMKKRKIWLMNGVEIIFNTFFFNCVALFPVVAGKFAYKPEMVAKYGNYSSTMTFNSQALVIAYLPYDTDSWPGYILCTLTEYYIAIVTLFLLDATDLGFIGIAEEMCNELEILNITLRYSKRRALYVYRKKYGEVGKSLRCKKLSICLGHCLKDSVKHHMAITDYFKDVLKCYTMVVFFIMCTGAFLLCMSGIIFVSKRVKVALKMAFLLYLLGETTHVFIFSYYGEKINGLSLETREMVYQMEWEDVDSKALLPYISILLSKTSEPMRLSAGSLIFCNFDTFGNVVSSAYSYFNILSATTDL